MSALASIIIPCFNAERWIAEAIQSCLDQTWSNCEVIVIDDGSTDASVEKIKAFGSQVRGEKGPNCGGNIARNRGFALSSGQFIQFLDADDYLLPQKIEHQVSFLEDSGADVVYGDWRHQHHRVDCTSELQEIAVSGAHNDVLEALLAGWWVAPAAVLFRREAILNAGGWDESLPAAQDRDFMISVAISGARIAYQPGCYSIYRRYGDVTVSTSSRRRWLDSHLRVLRKAESKLESTGGLTLRYRQALARSYFSLARNYFDIDRSEYRNVMETVRGLDPTFSPEQSASFNLTRRLVGYRLAEELASWKRRAKRRMGASEGA